MQLNSTEQFKRQTCEKEKRIKCYDKNGLEANKVNTIFVSLNECVKDTFIFSECKRKRDSFNGVGLKIRQAILN